MQGMFSQSFVTDNFSYFFLSNILWVTSYISLVGIWGSTWNVVDVAEKRHSRMGDKRTGGFGYTPA